MIIYHQKYVAAFKGAHVWYWPTQPRITQRITITSDAPVTTGQLLSLRYVKNFNIGHGGGMR